MRYGKYNNKKTEYDGILYDSQKEAAYAQTLDLLKKAKGKDKVLSYVPQMPFLIEIKGKRICKYLLDFMVSYDDRIEYIDVKGYKKGPAYAMFRIKKKLVEAMFEIQIKEV